MPLNSKIITTTFISATDWYFTYWFTKWCTEWTSKVYLWCKHFTFYF